MASLCKCCRFCLRQVNATTVVACAVCKKQFHHICLSLTLSEAKMIKSTTNFRWNCDECLKFDGEITDLRRELIKLAKQVKSKEIAMDDDAVSEFTEEIIREIKDRNNKFNNVVAYHVAESATRSETEDENTIKMIFNLVAPNANITSFSFARIRSVYNNQPRAIKIKLNSYDDVKAVLKNKEALSQSELYKDVYLKYDMTIHQETYKKLIRRRLAERIAKGELNLKIEYKNASPYILESGPEGAKATPDKNAATASHSRST